MKFFAGFWLGVMAVLLVGTAYQLSPIDQQQNDRLNGHDAQFATIEYYLWSNPDPKDNLPITPTAEGTATPSPTMRPSPTVTPTATITAVPIGTPSPTVTELPPMTFAGNVSGVSLWVRECPALTCDIMARVYPGEFVTVNRERVVVADGYEWVALWNHADGVIGGWVAMRRISPPGRLMALRP